MHKFNFKQDSTRTDKMQKQLGATLWGIADQLRGAMNADDFCDYTLEYLIGQFAAGSGKKAGEFYTPQQISTILPRIVTLDSQNPGAGKKKRLKKILDFTCGSGSLLLHVHKQLGPDCVGQMYGQEKNITTYNLARMNMLLQDGNIDTVIGLPANLFFSTGIPVCILVVKKWKKSDDILFINASDHFEKGKRQNVLLSTHIDKIVDTYQLRKEEERYSRRVPMDEVIKNEYNLNISRYVSTAVAEELIDIKQVNTDLQDITRTITKAKETHNGFLKELGLAELP